MNPAAEGTTYPAVPFTVEPSRGSPGGEESQVTVSVGDELPELARVVTREDVKAYADAGGDQNPLHQDDDAARSAGFSGIIAHGMFTMGHMAAAVVAWAGEPD